MTILIGYLHDREKPDRFWRVRTFASIAKWEGHEFIYFRPHDINIKTQTIHGSVYKNGEWVKTMSRLPDVIYNEPLGELTAEDYDNLSGLRELVPFTCHSANTKLNLYRKLLETGTFADFVIPYKKVNSEVDVLDFIYKYGKAVLKPARGQRGRDIFFVYYKYGDYIVETKGRPKTYSKKQFIRLLTEILAREDYILQKYILCKTRDGFCYDFRLHTQKNGEGKWEVLAMVPRVARKGTIVSNIGNGGLTGLITPFLQYEFGDKGYDIEHFLRRFAIDLSKHLEDINDVSFDELGIDVGIDANKDLWIYEVNWKPGEVPFESHTNDIIRNAVLYAAYLAKQNSKSISDENTTER